MEIVFLGSGGGRWVTLLQRLRTGGFRIHGDMNIHIDPGPGCLIDMKEAGVNPFTTDACIVTHSHPDHYSDAELVVEAMTKAMTKTRGRLIGSESVVNGFKNLGPVVSEYHRSRLVEIHSLRSKDEVNLGNLKITALPTRHSDPTAIGLKLQGNGISIAYTCDTEYFPELSQSYTGVNLLIANVIRPGNKRIKWHLCTQDLIKLVQEAQPGFVVMQHFGMTMLDKMDKEARQVEKETGVETIAAKDFMRIRMGRGIDVEVPQQQ